MTAPTPEVAPSNSKTLVGLIGSALTFLIPALLSVQADLPAPWPAIIAAILAILTATGVYRAPYKPPQAVLVPDSPAVHQAVIEDIKPDGEYQNPWKP